jgi:hypothetical protein
MLRIAVLLSLACLLDAGCRSATQVLLVVRLDPARGVDQIRVSARSSTESFPAMLRPEVPAGPLADPQSVTLLLPDHLAGRVLTVAVEGLRQAKVLVSAAGSTIPVESERVSLEISLSGPPPRDGGPQDRLPEKTSCLDGDKDEVTICAGDCDDSDPNAHPLQTAFFTVPTRGSKNFDYNCDKVEEKEIKGLVSCVRVGAGCEGHGWQGSIPGCAEAAVFISCKPSGQTQCAHDQSQRVQACR